MKQRIKVKVFGIFPAEVVDDEIRLTDHWLNSWYMGWFFHVYTFLSLHDMERHSEEPMFWASPDSEEKKTP